MSRYIRASAIRFRNRLITLLGGDDPVTVQYLKYRAKLLAGMVEILEDPHKSYRLLEAAKAQACAIHQALSRLDHAR